MAIVRTNPARTRWSVVASCALLASCGGVENGEAPHRGGTAALGSLHEIRYVVAGKESRAALYVPSGYDRSEHEWPMIVFLHGLGERGDDNRAQTTVGLYPAIAERPERFPCLVLMPQCPSDRVWTELFVDWARDLPPATEHVDAALDAVLADYRVDRGRIAFTGLSMGGFGVLLHGPATIDRWCAVVAICGGGKAEHAPVLAKKPLWLIHGADDPVVPSRLSEELFAAVKAAGGDVALTIYDGVGHASWNRAYRDPRVVEFLLAPRDR